MDRGGGEDMLHHVSVCHRQYQGSVVCTLCCDCSALQHLDYPSRVVGITGASMVPSVHIVMVWHEPGHVSARQQTLTSKTKQSENPRHEAHPHLEEPATALVHALRSLAPGSLAERGECAPQQLEFGVSWDVR